jgi:hypothetical protein
MEGRKRKKTKVEPNTVPSGEAKVDEVLEQLKRLAQQFKGITKVKER